MLRNLGVVCMALLGLTTARAGDNDLIWDYTEKAPTANPDNGLYYGGKVDDATGTKNGLKGIKLNSSGYAYFSKAEVAGTLSLTIGKREGTGDFSVDVYACTIDADGKATIIDIDGDAENGETPIATTDIVTELNTVKVDISADVTGIYIKRNIAAEGVLSKIVFKETVARSFVDFEIKNEELVGEYDATSLPSGVLFSGTNRGDSHGYGNVTLVVPVDGAVKFTIGGCQYYTKGELSIKNSDDEVVGTISLNTSKCYHEDGSAVTYVYAGEATTLTFGGIQYLPYFKAEAIEVSEATITYKNQNGDVLGTKIVYEGDAIGASPYTESDLTIADGYAFRGWVYANGVKVTEADLVSGNTTVLASVTAIESVAEGSIQNYDLTLTTFYAEDHETFSVVNGQYYNNHGWTFNEGGSFSVDVAGKAQIVLTLCQYGNGTTMTVTDKEGNIIATDVPAKASADGDLATVQYDGEATTLTFTMAQQTFLHKVAVYNVSDFLEKDEKSGYYIVPASDAASLILAINSASAEVGAKIFLPNGTYDLGESVLTTISGTNVSLIGENMDKTIIVTAPPTSKEGLGSADLLINTGEGLYIQDLTLKNALDYYSVGTGRAVTLHDKGTKTINKNVKHLSYQDTYYSHKVGGVFYFEGGEVHGTVDYLCGNGKVYFNEVTLVNESRSSATITANSELYVFNNCVIENNADTYNLGRAWSDNPICVFLNTTLNDPNKLISTRWNLSGINCDYSIAGEYATKNSDGEDITPETNIITFTKANTTLNTILDATALDTYSIENVLGEWATTAQNDAVQVKISAVDNSTDGKVTWTLPIADGILMLSAVDENGNEDYIKIGKLGSELNTTELDAYMAERGAKYLTIRAANGRGGFGESVVIYGDVPTIANEVSMPTEIVSVEYFTLNGQKLSKPAHGLNIVRTNYSDGTTTNAKILVK